MLYSGRIYLATPAIARERAEIAVAKRVATGMVTHSLAFGVDASIRRFTQIFPSALEQVEGVKN